VVESVHDELAIRALTVREITKSVSRLRKTRPEIAATLDMKVTAIFNMFGGQILATGWLPKNGVRLSVNERSTSITQVLQQLRMYIV